MTCSLDCFGDEPLHDALPRIADAGFEAVELSWNGAERAFPAERNRADRLRSLLQKYSLTASSVNVTDCAATRPTPAWLSQFEQEMIFARLLGVVGVNIRAGERKRQSVAALTLVLDAVMERADALEMNVNLANALGRRVEQLEDVRRIVAEIKHPRLRVLIDAGHAHMAAVNPVHLIGEFIDLADVVRFSDRLGRQRVAIGDGEVNSMTFLSELRRAEFNGPLVYEPPREGRDTKSLTGTRNYLHHISSLLP
jgi:sugar phosphate isomerase/epimerase